MGEVALEGISLHPKERVGKKKKEAAITRGGKKSQRYSLKNCRVGEEWRKKIFRVERGEGAEKGGRDSLCVYPSE